MSAAPIEDTPGYIYRQGPDRAKSRSLHRVQDWLTGLSFTDAPVAGPSITFALVALRDAGYAVRTDGGEPVRPLWREEPVIDPGTGTQAVFPSIIVIACTGTPGIRPTC